MPLFTPVEVLTRAITVECLPYSHTLRCPNVEKLA